MEVNWTPGTPGRDKRMWIRFHGVVAKESDGDYVESH